MVLRFKLLAMPSAKSGPQTLGKSQSRLPAPLPPETHLRWLKARFPVLVGIRLDSMHIYHRLNVARDLERTLEQMPDGARLRTQIAGALRPVGYPDNENINTLMSGMEKMLGTLFNNAYGSGGKRIDIAKELAALKADGELPVLFLYWHLLKTLEAAMGDGALAPVRLEVVHRLFGFNGFEPHTYRQVADVIGKAVSRVSQHRGNALRRLTYRTVLANLKFFVPPQISGQPDFPLALPDADTSE